MPVLSDTSASEDKVQGSIVEYLRLVLPQGIVFSIPNGGLRSKREVQKLLWTGVLAGIPDLAVALPGGRILFIEVKKVGGTLSIEQRSIHAVLTELGHSVVVVRSISETRAALQAAGIQTKEAA